METNKSLRKFDLDFVLTKPLTILNITNSSEQQDKQLEPVFTIVGFSLGVFGNLLALIVLFHSAKIHKWKVFYKMITILSFVDLMGISTLSPMVLAVYGNNLQWVGGQSLCHFFSFIVIFSGLCTCLIISVMAVDRFIAIVHPFKYRTLHKDKIANIGIPSIILFSAFVSVLPIVGLGEVVVHFPGSWCFPNFYDRTLKTSIFSFIYSFLILLLILQTAVLNIWALAKLIVGKRSYVRRDSTTSISHSKRNIDIYIMILLIVIFVVFAVCWSPFVVRIIISQIRGPPNDMMMDLVTLRMASFNQILDPWVYLLFRRESLRRLVAQVNKLLPMSHRANALARLFSISSRSSQVVIPDESFLRNLRKLRKDASLSQDDLDDYVNSDRSNQSMKTQLSTEL